MQSLELCRWCRLRSSLRNRSRWLLLVCDVRPAVATPVCCLDAVSLLDPAISQRGDACRFPQIVDAVGRPLQSSRPRRLMARSKDPRWES